ncbi:ME6 [Symbiodinium microadriaticum]|nr:ME6 [Symbiodinium microadriaticum]
MLLNNPLWNKGSSFSRSERDTLEVRGLVPCGDPVPLEVKVDNAMKQLQEKDTDLDKYVFLHTIQDSDETLFYAMLEAHLVELIPYVYTPTVGEACQKWSKLYRQTLRGLYIGLDDAGKIKQIMRNHPARNIKAIVVTDGERILGLGDLGVNGMGIPVGKLSLYTACAGIAPDQCLPVHVDVGTNRAELLADPGYLGLRRRRESGEQYDALMSEFITAAQETYGRQVLIQDFANNNAFRLLAAHRETSTSFNDDIQGTAAVVVAGLLASPALTGRELKDQRYLFFGAGAAGVGIADLLARTLAAEAEGRSEGDVQNMVEWRQKIWLVDSKGLVTADRPDLNSLQAHKLPYAHPLRLLSSETGNSTEQTCDTSPLLAAIEAVRPSVLIGVSAQGGAFDEEVCRRMADINQAHPPVIFALSNPTSKSECSPRDANRWYIFPGIALAAVVTGASTIKDSDFSTAAGALAKQVPFPQVPKC